MKTNDNQKLNTSQREQILILNMKSLFKKLALPAMIGMAVIGLYNLMDAIFVGQLIGKNAVGAVALVYSVLLINQGILLLVGSGSMALLSLSIGKKDLKTINKLLGNMIVVIFLASGLYSLIVYFTAHLILPLIGGEGEVALLAIRYLRVIAIGMIFAALGPAINFLIRGEGKLKTAMYFAGGSSLLNILLNPLFISVFNMGIEGAALATVISQIAYVIAQLIYFTKGNSVISLQNMKLKIEKSVLAPIFKVGIAQFIMMLMATIQQVLLFRGLTFYGGNTHVILMGASYRTFTFAFILVWGVGQGMQPAIGINYGAEQKLRVKKIFRSFSLYGLFISFPLWLIFMLFPSTVLSLFITDASIVASGINLFRIINIIFFAYIYFATSMNLQIGLGRGKEAGIIAISRQIIFFIPLVLILPLFLGPIGIWISLPLADLLTLLLIYFFNKRTFSQSEFNPAKSKMGGV